MELTFLGDATGSPGTALLTRTTWSRPPSSTILIYNHLSMPDPPALAGEWITFSSVPASHAKDKAWAGHVEEVIARHFTDDIEGLKQACERLGGKAPRRSREAMTLPTSSGSSPGTRPSCSSTTRSRPRTSPPSASCSWTRPSTTLDQSIVVLGEEFAGRITGKV